MITLPASSRNCCGSRPEAVTHQRPSGRSHSTRTDRSTITSPTTRSRTQISPGIHGADDQHPVENSHSPPQPLTEAPVQISSSGAITVARVTGREKYDRMIRDEVGPWLRELGFKKRRNRFRRADNNGWHVVDFQASQWGTRDDVRFTINLWVGVTELAEADADSQVQQRIGALLPGGEDHWWSLNANSDTAASNCQMLWIGA